MSNDDNNAAFERELQRIAKKYRSLPPQKLIATDLKNQRQYTREIQATASAAVTIPLTKGLSAPFHAGVAGYHGTKVFEKSIKKEMSGHIVREQGFERQKPRFLDTVEDKARGIAMGKSGAKVVKDAKVSAWNKFKDMVHN